MMTSKSLPNMPPRALRAVITRPAERQGVLGSQLTAAGWTVLSLPALELRALDPLRLTDEDQPAQYDWVMFVSQTAWRVYWQKIGQSWPESTRVAAVGLATAQAIALDLPSHVELLTPSPPDHQDSESLWNLLEPRLTADAKVLIVAGNEGRTWLRERLRAFGVAVRVINVYERRAAHLSSEAIETLQQWSESEGGRVAGVWLLTSSHGIAALTRALYDRGWLRKIAPDGLVVVHPRLVEPAKALLADMGAAPDTPVWVSDPDGPGLLITFERIRQILRRGP